MYRYFLCVMGVLLALPLLVLVVLALMLPVTVWGMVYLLGAGLIVFGLILAPRIASFTIPITGGFVIIVLIAGTRALLVQNTDSHLKLIALPPEKRTSWLNTLIDEQDALLFGETFFHWIGGDSDSEHAGLASAFRRVYSEMRKEGNFPSPVLSTYLNQQQPEHFDAVIVEPETNAQFGVVFLHGYMGNVTAQCWVIAQAVQELGGVTICPSTIWTGEWWKPDGQRVLQSTFDYLRAQGITAIYLGGFSNGGFSIGRLASQVADQKGLSGLIFIDGFINGTSVRELGLPVLILEGTQDERVPVETAHTFAAEVGDLGTYVEVDSDHFLIIKQPAMVQDAIGSWLGKQEVHK